MLNDRNVKFLRIKNLLFAAANDEREQVVGNVTNCPTSTAWKPKRPSFFNSPLTDFKTYDGMFVIEYKMSSEVATLPKVNPSRVELLAQSLIVFGGINVAKSGLVAG